MSVEDDLRIVRSVIDDLRSRPISGRCDFCDFTDKHAITQVEKWMAIIREITQEQLSFDLITDAKIDERTKLMVAMADKIIEANRTKREST